MKDYKHYMDLFKEQLNKLYEIAPTIKSIDDIQDENKKKEFIETFRDLTKQLTKLKTFTEFDFNEEKLGISEQKYEDYKSKYFGIYDGVKNSDKTSILVDIDFGIELMQTDKINVSYILNLIRSIDFNTEEKVKSDVEKIKKLLDKADNDNLRLKADLIREFLDKEIPNATKNDSVDELFNNFLEDKRVNEIIEFSKDVKLEGEKVKSFITEYEYSGKIDGSAIKDSVHGGLLQKKRVSERIKNFILNHVKKFTF